jgi:hypothetical protein
MDWMLLLFTRAAYVIDSPDEKEGCRDNPLWVTIINGSSN